MAFQAVPNGLEVKFVFDQNGTPLVNIYNFETADTVSSTDLGNAVVAGAEWWVDHASYNMHESVVLQQIVATDLSVENGQQEILTTFTQAAGRGTGAAASGQTAGVISWRTPFTGRSYRGRSYFGGLTAANLTNAQTLAGSYITGLVSTGQELIDIFQDVSLVLSVLSRVTDGVQRIVGILTAITSFVIDNKVDTQRRRSAN